MDEEDLTAQENLYLKNYYKKRTIQRNVITKYAFATRVGFIPNNPSKVN